MFFGIKIYSFHIFKWVKYMDKFKRNKSLSIFLLIMLIVGVISGIIFSTVLSAQDKTLVTNYLNSFFNNINSNKFDYTNALFNTLGNNYLYIFFMWLLGISIVGIPIIIFMFFAKSFMLGFIISAFLINYKWKGLLYTFLYVFPHQLINLFAYLLLSIYALKIAFRMLSSIYKKETINFGRMIRFYARILLLVISILTVTTLYEIYVVPYLIKLVI